MFLFLEPNRKYVHLKWLLNLDSVSTHKTNCLSELSVSWFRSSTEERVNTILLSQSLCGGSGKQCRLNWPASSVYPRGPKFTYETAEHSCICSARTHRYTHSSHSDASNGVHLSIESNNPERFLPMYTSRKDKCASEHVLAHTQRQTCIQIWGHWWLLYTKLRHVHAGKQACRCAIHFVAASVWTRTFMALGRQPLAFLRHWKRGILTNLAPFVRLRFY